jgi:hypothetical protein
MREKWHQIVNAIIRIGNVDKDELRAILIASFSKTRIAELGADELRELAIELIRKV